MFNSEWYQNLNRPPLAPEPWIFKPVWIVIYVSILIALILFIKSKNHDKTKGYVYFFIQMMLNLVWSPVFFNLHNIGLALIVIILLDIFIFLTVREFYRASIYSGTILIPYQLWVLFATYLNIGYFVLN